MGYKEILKVLFFLFCNSVSYGNNNVTVFLDWNYLYTISVYQDSSAKEIISMIKSQYIEYDQDEVIMIDILDVIDSMYYVEIYGGSTNSNYGKGWIKKEEPLYMMAKVYTPYDTIQIYNEPNKENYIAFLLDSNNIPLDGMIKIIDINTDKRWFKISFFYNDKNIIGWIPSYNLCGNPYTTCG
jgi:hypothetical protein